jgi:cytoplasmic tRNA 2-thiolation protein 1
MRICELCQVQKASLTRPRNGQRVCKECFFNAFETEIHETIVQNNLFSPGDRVAIAASGGKDSTVLAHILALLNERHQYKCELMLLSIDEGITGYRDDSLECVKEAKVIYDIPLKIVSYKDLYGYSMDDVVRETGLKNNCTFCGVFRRQALDRGADAIKATKLVTGHNADDIAETVLMNLLRGDIARLGRCTAISTAGDFMSSNNDSDLTCGNTSEKNDASNIDDIDFDDEDNSLMRLKGPIKLLPRCKPFKYTYEKEIVLYAHFKKLKYHATECIYSPNAYRGYAREFIKEIEMVRPSSILDVIRSAETWKVDTASKGLDAEEDLVASGNSNRSVVSGTSQMSTSLQMKLQAKSRPQGLCTKCGYMSSSGTICQACALLEGLEKGQPLLALRN